MAESGTPNPARDIAPPPPAAAAVAVAVTILSWALAFPLIRVALAEMSPLPLAAARFALSAAILLPLIAAARLRLPSPADGARFLLCGLFGIALYNALLNAGQETVTASAASFIINTSPVFTVLLAALALRERFPLRAWAGTGISLAGVGLISAAQPGGLSFGAGAMLVLAAAICQASFFVLQRPLVQKYGAIAATAWTLTAGSLLLLPWLPAALSELRSAESAETIGAVVALAVVPSLLGYGAWTFALARFGASRAANFLYLVPPTATLLAFFIAAEVPAALTILGGGIAIFGVAIVNLPARQSQPADGR